MSILDSVLKVFVGDKSKQDVKSLSPIIDKVKAFESELEQLSHDELRAKTVLFKEKIAEARQPLQDKIDQLLIDAETTEDIDQREDMFLEVEKLNDQIYEVTEAVLDDIMAEAYAVVKETAKRFVNNTELPVTAN